MELACCGCLLESPQWGTYGSRKAHIQGDRRRKKKAPKPSLSEAVLKYFKPYSTHSFAYNLAQMNWNFSKLHLVLWQQNSLPYYKISCQLTMIIDNKLQLSKHWTVQQTHCACLAVRISLHQTKAVWIFKDNGWLKLLLESCINSCLNMVHAGQPSSNTHNCPQK